MRVVSFSYKPSDKKTEKLIAELKKQSVNKGIKFSHMVIEGLKMYKEANSER